MIEEVFQTIKGSINKQYFGNSKFYYNKSATTGHIRLWSNPLQVYIIWTQVLIYLLG